MKEKEVCPDYLSKINLNFEIVLPMIPYYLALKKVFALLRGITSKHDGNFYYLNCLHSLRTENKLKSHEKVCENKVFCGVVIPSDKNNILEFNQYMNSDKIPYVFYPDIESLKTQKNSSTTKISTYSLHILNVNNLGIWSHRKQTYFISRKRLYEKFLIEKLILKIKKMLPLTKEELKSHQDANICDIWGKRILKKLSKSIK